ncbi:Hypothetical protein R9X50_00150600 [Acrodontium crateriforme]|uniref:PAS domain-containing protein n=1 Tax=Acrodontium crateriforme TaxID=150365 RepID=A0AAQ3LZV0_9PEZI|nr:Hypothetical protein R9X50_00150600 [Acrodontium crateriforme]
MFRSYSARSSKRDSVHQYSTDRDSDSRAAKFRLYPVTQSPIQPRVLRPIDSKIQMASLPRNSTGNLRRNKDSLDYGVRFASPESQSDSSHGFGEALMEDFQDMYAQSMARPSSQFSSRGPEDAPQTELPAPPARNSRHSPETAYDYQARSRYDSITSAEDDYSSRSVSRNQFHRLAPAASIPSPTSKRSTAILSRLSSSALRSSPDRNTPDAISPTYDRTARSSAESVFSHETVATSINTQAPLQTKNPDGHSTEDLDPLVEDDPASFDLLPPHQFDEEIGQYKLERQAELLFSEAHLRAIFADPQLLLKFTGFLNSHRPQSIPILVYYLDALKAIRAINYSNGIALALDPIRFHSFTNKTPPPTRNFALEEKAEQAFAVMVNNDLPAFITFQWSQIISSQVQRRIHGTLAPHLRDASEGLGEVFCLTDPNRPDNPIVFASEAFARMTQYGLNHCVGRNCRFLQGPKTDANSIARLADAIREGRPTTETFLNYRRDGTPFMTMLCVFPLKDTQGQLKYYLGSQIDCSALAKNCTSLRGLQKLVDKQKSMENDEEDTSNKDVLEDLCEMFNTIELEKVRRSGGRIYKDYAHDNETDAPPPTGMRRVVLTDLGQENLDAQQAKSRAGNSTPSTMRMRMESKVDPMYPHWLLIRPAPSSRILFTSPSLRVPGVPQSSFFSRIGGSSRVRDELKSAMQEGRGVTAKVRWLTRPHENGEGEGRSRWIHCTPLLSITGDVGAWMIILVDDEIAPNPDGGRRFRAAPPVATNIGGKEWDRRRLQTPEPTFASNDQERRIIPEHHVELDATRRSFSAQDHHLAGQFPQRSASRLTRHTPQSGNRDLNEFSFNLDL